MYGTAVILLLCLDHAASAATVDETLDIDLGPLIDQAAQSPTRFAIDIPHAVSVDHVGTWTSTASTKTWTYAIRIPTAVSMSFHASRASLPPGAVLTITGSGGAKTTYTARDISRGGLWTRPLPGDTLFLSLSVPEAQQSQLLFQIQSVQAGYRGLGGVVPDHPEYKRIAPRLRQQSSNCMLNYACEATSANQGPANATVAIVVANVAQCTGTLVNDTSGDGTPYILTARHCENGTYGGGNPAAAANVTVYWDAVSPCGASIGSIYDGNSITQTGATTVVEQQDAWLIRLDAPPRASDAYYAGWDATGGVFTGGYSVHHALGFDKQYVGWYGQAILQSIPGSALNIGYTSNFWGVVNGTGSGGPGDSGGALFDPNNHTVGSSSRGLNIGGPDTPGICPADPPPAPTPTTVTDVYTALSAIWSSTSDTTSTTGSATFQSVLDAAGTGKLVIDGLGPLPVTLTVDQSIPSTGQMVHLAWNALGAQTCTASGGFMGDGWGGSLGASGTLSLTEQGGGPINYSLRCSASGEIGWASVTVYWQFVPAFVNFSITSGPNSNAGSMVQLQWASNAQPCTASGGASGDGWPGSKPSSGSQSVLASVLGNVTYSLTCGSGGRVATNQVMVTVLAPYVSTIQSDANNLLAGQPVNLEFGAGGDCTKSGGAGGDGWAGPLVTSGVSVTEATAGTYTYTVTCTGAGATANLSASNSITLTFTNAAPTVTLTASPSNPELYTDPGAEASVLTLSWNSNVRPCAISAVGPGNSQESVDTLDGAMPTGTAQDDPLVAGSYLYTVTCGTGQSPAQATKTVTWFTNDPAVTLFFVATPWPLGVQFGGITWQSNVYPCSAIDGASGDGWAGSQGATAASGGASLIESTPGPITFGITCGSGAQTAQAQSTTNVITPTASISASANTLAVGTELTLSWNANFGGCTLSSAPGGVVGQSLGETGQFILLKLIAGTYTYTINCVGAQASTQVTFTGAATTLTASASNVSVGSPVTLTWNSQGATACMPSAGTPNDGWTGTLSSSGSIIVTSWTASTVTYSILCTNPQGQSQAQTQVTYTPVGATEPTIPTPSVTLKTSAASQIEGSPVTLTWMSQNASACTASGGGNADGWSGALALSGTMSITESTTGSFTYDITCTGAPPAATADALVDFTDTSVTVTGGGGTGGGGALDFGSLILLVLSVSLRLRRESPGHVSERRLKVRPSSVGPCAESTSVRCAQRP
ncbi:MAG: hypothetical protein ACREUT_10810 [Steroidobacteraceae bacterium]